MGDSSAGALAELAKILTRKGYNVLGTRNFLMPNNMLLIRPESANLIKAAKGVERAKEFANNILNSKEKAARSNVLTKVSFALTTFAWRLLQTKPMQKLFKFKLKKDLCVKCNKCALYCPVKNITPNAEGLPEFNLNCNFCMRCISYCPKNAIKFFVLNSKVYKALDAQGEKECFHPNF
jgi:NAD-dependent dihydropyrimidine dehydrogenase PreA subunit